MDENTRFVVEYIESRFDRLEARMQVQFAALRVDIDKEMQRLERGVDQNKRELSHISGLRNKLVGVSVTLSFIMSTAIACAGIYFSKT